MKKLLMPLVILLSIILFTGCKSRVSSLSAGQQKAVKNSIEFIKKSSFTSKDRIDINIVSIKNAQENTWESVIAKDSKVGKNAIDTTDWVISIGDTSEHDFVVIVCDSSTYEAIGYIEIK